MLCNCLQGIPAWRGSAQPRATPHGPACTQAQVQHRQPRAWPGLLMNGGAARSTHMRLGMPLLTWISEGVARLITGCLSASRSLSTASTSSLDSRPRFSSTLRAAGLEIQLAGGGRRRRRKLNRGAWATVGQHFLA